MMTRRILHAGDLIYLEVEEGGYVHIEGCTDFRLGCLPPSSASSDSRLPFAECLFRVTPKLLYDMTKSYKKAINVRSKKVLEPEDRDVLRSNVAREEESNAACLDRIVETECQITYGATIQLQHVKSGKFVVAMSRTLAEMDKGRLRIGVLEKGSSKAWFTLRPCYKTRTTGSFVYFSDFVTIARAKCPDQKLNVSSFPYARDQYNRKEINLHHNGSRMQLKRYAEGVSKEDKTFQVTFLLTFDCWFFFKQYNIN